MWAVRIQLIFITRMGERPESEPEVVAGVYESVFRRLRHYKAKKDAGSVFGFLNIKRYKFESNGWDYLWVYFTFEFICRAQIQSTVTLEFMIVSYRIPKLISSFCVCLSIDRQWPITSHQLIQNGNCVHAVPSRGWAIKFIGRASHSPVVLVE